MSEKERIGYFDYLRIFAMLAVILSHATNSMAGAKMSAATKDAFCFLHIGSNWGVEVFLMISGALFLSPIVNVTVGKIWRRNIFRMARVLVFWNIVYAIVSVLTGISSAAPRKIAYAIIEGPAHFWYLYMTITLYACVPILRKMTDSMDITRYFLLILAFLTILYPDFCKLLPLRPFQTIEGRWNVFGSCYLFYFVAGSYFSRTELKRGMRLAIYAAAVIALVADTAYFIRSGSGLETCRMLFSLAIFTLAKQTLGEKAVGKTVRKLSGLTFGAYILHWQILKLIGRYLNPIAHFDAWSAFALNMILCTALSLAGAALLDRIPFVKKYLI